MTHEHGDHLGGVQPQMLGQALETPALLPYWLGAWAIQALPFLAPETASRLPFVLLLGLTLLGGAILVSGSLLGAGSVTLGGGEIIVLASNALWTLYSLKAQAWFGFYARSPREDGVRLVLRPGQYCIELEQPAPVRQSQPALLSDEQSAQQAPEPHVSDPKAPAAAPRRLILATLLVVVVSAGALIAAAWGRGRRAARRPGG